MELYAKRAEKLEEKALDLRSASDWKHIKTLNGIKVFTKKSPDFNGNAFKFTGEMDAPYDAIYDVMKPPATTEERLSWDKSIFHYEMLKSISPEMAIGSIVSHPAVMGLISKREFVTFWYFKTYEDKFASDGYGKMSWIFAESFDEFKPPNPALNIVRACNYPAGYAVAENIKDPQKSYLEYYINCDIGGMLPRSLVEGAIPSQQVSYVESVRKEVLRRLGR